MRIYPFDALRPTPEMAKEVACVPYDVVSREEARALAERKPWTFMRVGRPEVNLAPDVDMYSDEVYRKAREVFDLFQAQRVLVREGRPLLYVYRLALGAHAQHGVVACCNVGDVDRGIVLRHEHTRADKLADRVRLTGALRAHSGPIYLTYRGTPAIDRLVAECEKRPALFDFTAYGDVRHTAWRVDDVPGLVAAFEHVPRCYVADGHHRLAAAGEVSRRLAREDGVGVDGPVRECDRFMGVFFPAAQLRIMAYNRCVRDLNGRAAGAFLAACAQLCEVSAGSAEREPGPGEIGMYLAGKWHLLRGLARGHTAASPVAQLDVSVLQDRILGPLLGIADPRTSERILFVGGIRGRAELVKMVDGGAAAVAFAMHPVSVEQVMSIADAGMIMPPKSTWFEPKLKSGLFVHTF